MAEEKGMSMVGNSWYVIFAINKSLLPVTGTNTAAGFTRQSTWTTRRNHQRRIRKRHGASLERGQCWAGNNGPPNRHQPSTHGAVMITTLITTCHSHLHRSLRRNIGVDINKFCSIERAELPLFFLSQEALSVHFMNREAQLRIGISGAAGRKDRPRMADGRTAWFISYNLWRKTNYLCIVIICFMSIHFLVEDPALWASPCKRRCLLNIVSILSVIVFTWAELSRRT